MLQLTDLNRINSFTRVYTLKSLDQIKLLGFILFLVCVNLTYTRCLQSLLFSFFSSTIKENYILFYSVNSCSNEYSTTKAFKFTKEQTAITLQNNYNLQIIINGNNRSIEMNAWIDPVRVAGNFRNETNINAFKDAVVQNIINFVLCHQQLCDKK